MNVRILIMTVCLLSGPAVAKVDYRGGREQYVPTTDCQRERADTPVQDRDRGQAAAPTDVQPPTAPPSWEDSARKNRYISLCSSNVQPVAYQVEMTAGPGPTGVLGWIGPPDANSVSRVVQTPYFGGLWPCPLHVGDCEVVPGATYEVRATPDGETFSIPLEVGTIHGPTPRYYGDVVGPVDPITLTFAPPNGIVNVDDISAYLFTVHGPPKPTVPTVWVDLHGNGYGSPPNYILNISDLQRILFGFEGQQYTDAPGQLVPADCAAGPRVGHCGNSGCLFGTQRGTDDHEYPCASDDYFELAAGIGTLDIVHYSATYNCCPDDIFVALSVVGSHLELTEQEILVSGGCFCTCCYDVETTVVDLEPGDYTFEYCWWDYETEQEQCYSGDVVIPATLPRLGGYGNSGCLSGGNREADDQYPFCNDEHLELNVDVDALHFVHHDATYNCCPDDIVVTFSVHGNHLGLTEEEVLLSGGCDCLCCFDVEATIVDLEPGEYTFEYCWWDYETGQEQCHTGEVVVPAPSPSLGGYGNGGCLTEGGLRDGDDVYPFCGDDQFAFTVDGDTLNIAHENTTYNCCPDDIVVSLVVDGMVLRLTENEILTMPCFCMCCYNVESRVVNLTPGIYTVEYCWYDEETQQDACHIEDIEVP